LFNMTWRCAVKKSFTVCFLGLWLTILFLMNPTFSQATCSSTSTIINNGYIGACGYTNSTTFTLSQNSEIANIRVWYDTSVGGSSLAATLNGPNGYSKTVTLAKSSACQWSWCEANWALGQTLSAGSYTLTIGSKSMCYDPSGKTTLGITGCAASSTTSSTTATSATSSSATSSSDSTVATQVSLPDLVDAIGAMPLAATPPREFFTDDPLGIADISFSASDALLRGDTIRINNIVVGEQAANVDFKLFIQDGLRFNISTAGFGVTPPLPNGTIPGLDLSATTAYLTGPPLRVQLLPVGFQGNNYALGLLFDNKSGLALESVTNVSVDATDFMKSTKKTSKGFSAFWGKSIDDLITEKTTVDMELPSGTDWDSAVLNCATKVIETLNVGSVGAKALKMMGSSGPRIFQDMRTHLLLGNPADATLVFSEFAWKAFADNVTSKDEYIQVLQAIAKNSSYGRAIASGAGTCGVDYKEALKVVLKGFADKAFPIGSCLAGVGWQSGLQARSMLNNVLIRNLYDKWVDYGDDVFTYGSTRGQDGVIGYVASTTPPGKNPYQINDNDRTAAVAKLKKTFAQWKKAQDNIASSKLRPQLLALKTRYQSLSASDKKAISAYAGENPSEADSFWSYVQLMQRSRARLAPYATYINDDDLNYYSEEAVLALAKNGSNGMNAWKQVIAKDLQAWDKNLTTEPAACKQTTTTTPASTGTVTGSTNISTAGKKGDYLWLSVTLGNVSNFKTVDSDGWRSKGADFSAKTDGSGSVPITIDLGATGWSYYDYGVTVTIKNATTGEVYLSKPKETLAKEGGSKSYTYTWDAKAKPGNISIKADIGGGNPESSYRYISGGVGTTP